MLLKIGEIQVVHFRQQDFHGWRIQWPSDVLNANPPFSSEIHLDDFGGVAEF